MLVDSGNLVNDLISLEFAKKIRVPFTPVEKKIGTAAKGGSVNIVGRSEPFKIFIENMPKAVVIHPFIVKDLSHPINVGRDFLGRNGGKLEYNPQEGYLEIGGDKVKMVKKRAVINDHTVTDVRLLKVIQQFGQNEETDMIYDGRVNACEVNEEGCQMYNKYNCEIPANSVKFVAITTNGVLKLPLKPSQVLIMEPNVKQEISVLVTPGVGEVKEKTAYCCLVNPHMERIKVPAGTLLGTVTIIEEGQVMSVEGEVGSEKENESGDDSDSGSKL